MSSYLSFTSCLNKKVQKTEQTRDIEPLLFQCWVSVVDGGPTIKQQWLNISCYKGIRYIKPISGQCWPSVADSGPTSNQQWVNVSFLLGTLKIRCLSNAGPTSQTVAQH